MAGPLKYPPSQNAVQKTLGGSLSAGTTASVTLNNVTGLQNKSGVFVVDRVDTNGVETPSKREFIGYAGTSGSTLVTLVRNIDGSGTDQDHAVGAIVEFIPDVVWAQALSDALANIVNVTTLAVDPTKVMTPSAPQIILGSDAQGDMYYRLSGASLSRLAKGSVGQKLVVNATLPAWTYGGWNTISDASTMYVDFSLGDKFQATIVPSGSRTFAATNATVGQVALLRVKYASTASLAVNLLTVGATISWYGSSAPTPTATVNKVDLFGFTCIGSTPEFDGVIVGQNR